MILKIENLKKVGSEDAKKEENLKILEKEIKINLVGPEYLGEGAINVNEIAGSSLTAVNDLLKQNFLSQQIKSASNSSSRPA